MPFPTNDNFTLGDLLFPEELERVNLDCWPTLPVRRLCSDSRLVGPRDLFVATSGQQTEGIQYLEEAIKRGATSVVVGRSNDFSYALEVIARNSPQVCLLQVKDIRLQLARFAKRYHGCPDQNLRIVGVTGTNGKTSVAWILAEACFALDNAPSAYLGTLGQKLLGLDKPCLDSAVPYTTPESLTLWNCLDLCEEQGVKTVALEVSSHALDQQRVSEIDFDCAIFTNLTRDHLDYHHTMDEYGRVKELLFSSFLPSSKKKNRIAVTNLDDPFGIELKNRYHHQQPIIRWVTYSLDKEADISLRSSTLSYEKIEMLVSFGSVLQKIESQLIGHFNLSNILAAASCLWGLGYSPQEIATAIKQVTAVPGRMEVVRVKEFAVAIDYAHTPDALEKTQKVLRQLGCNRLITVFGCGGDRDRGKRPLMGQAVSSFSDLAYVTSDNPRSENPQQIIADIVVGLEKNQLDSHLTWFEVPDRRTAIIAALDEARPGDVVLIAGKGHEDYQDIMGVRHSFSDKEIVLEYAELPFLSGQQE